MDVLTKFTGNSETVLKVYTAEALRKVINVIAVTASKVKSQSSNISNQNTGGANQNAITEINEQLEDVDDAEW